MPDRSFPDSNILIYTDDHDMPKKQAVVMKLFERLRISGQGVVSTQVLQEYFAATTRKLGVPADIAYEKVRLFSKLQLVSVDLQIILEAIRLHQSYKFSFWDALIVQAALISGCSTVFTEDLQHKQRIKGVQIINPFID